MKKNWLLRIVFGIAGVLIVAVIAVLIWQKGYYGKRWYGNTTINGSNRHMLSADALKAQPL